MHTSHELNTRQGPAAESAELEAWIVGLTDACELPDTVALRTGATVRARLLAPETFERTLRGLDEPKRLAALYIALDGSDSYRAPAATLRADARFRQTRIYLVPNREEHARHDVREEELDIEYTLPVAVDRAQWRKQIESAVASFDAIGDNLTNGYYFLDTKYNDVFSWFERTRWDIRELPDFSEIRRDLLTPDQIQLIRHAAIAEFGTLPGAHNFLREWADDISFSNWALSWGAEESRHSLVLCRYLRTLGVEVMSKHALYKRKPYDSGPTQASTLMMNVISEARASETYERAAHMIEEPVAKKIFTLMSRDEARHASAFAQFCKEQCDLNEQNRVSAMEQAYFWLAQQQNGGFRHPAGEFYPHTQTAEGFSAAERQIGRDGTDSADASVLRMIRKIVRDDTIQSARDVKRWLRERIAMPAVSRAQS
jgi:rubrerythrin